MEQVAGFLIACVLSLLVHMVLTIGARSAGSRQLAALGDAVAAGVQFDCDVRASLSVDRPGRLIQRYRSGVVHVRPGSVCWEQRSRRRPVTYDLSAAVIAGESRLGLMDFDYVAGHQLTLRRGDQAISLLVRRPLAPLMKIGLSRPPTPGNRRYELAGPVRRIPTWTDKTPPPPEREADLRNQLALDDSRHAESDAMRESQ